MDRFIIGTGRCGSTLLSRMLAENSRLMMIFEFFSGLDIAGRFQPGDLDGEGFASLLGQDTPALSMVMKRGYEIAEVVYPYDSASRYRREQPIPWIVAAALARMSDQPDALFDDTLEFARSLPKQPLSAHYRHLFDWFAQTPGRDHWIEKSGSSIEYLGALNDFFPGARFLHLHRDGREAALSMREHHVYRLWTTLLFGDPAAFGATTADLGALDRAADEGGADPIGAMLDSRPPVELFGRYWTELVTRGFRALPGLNADQYLEVSFEDLVAEPRAVLRRIAEFFEFDANGGDWIERGAGLVRGIPPTRFHGLSEEEQDALSAACQAGRQLLGQVA